MLLFAYYFNIIPYNFIEQLKHVQFFCIHPFQKCIPVSYYYCYDIAPKHTCKVAQNSIGSLHIMEDPLLRHTFTGLHLASC